MGYWALALACGHTFAMGYKGWFDIATWPGRLPPITLLGFLAALSAVAVKLWLLARDAARPPVNSGEQDAAGARRAGG